MVQGTLTGFSDEKGYGFISPEAGGGHHFVHNSGIAEKGIREPQRGRQGLLRGEPGAEGHTGEQRLRGIARRATEL
jgi:cold shock protein